MVPGRKLVHHHYLCFVLIIIPCEHDNSYFKVEIRTSQYPCCWAYLMFCDPTDLCSFQRSHVVLYEQGLQRLVYCNIQSQPSAILRLVELIFYLSRSNTFKLQPLSFYRQPCQIISWLLKGTQHQL